MMAMSSQTTVVTFALVSPWSTARTPRRQRLEGSKRAYNAACHSSLPSALCLVLSGLVPYRLHLHAQVAQGLVNLGQRGRRAADALLFEPDETGIRSDGLADTLNRAI